MPEITTTASKNESPATATFPIQRLSTDQLKKLNSYSVADAVKFFSGVLVKDYGGIGGLKTVSVRSLSANHTGILYDGVLIPEGQGGQVDLGRFSTSYISNISLQNGSPSELLNTARAFTAASLVSLQTRALDTAILNKNIFRFQLSGGSFGLINPGVDATIKLSEHWGILANADYTHARGNYPYTDDINHLRLRRTNGDVSSFRSETNLYYSKKDQSQFNLKATYSASDRGLPGGIVLGNFYAAERLKDHNLFLQSRFQKKLGASTEFLLNGRFWNSYNYYNAPASSDQTSAFENTFNQNEFYISSAIKHFFTKQLSASYAIDYYYTNLFRRDSFAASQLFPTPSRNTLLNNITFKWELQKLTLQGNLLHTSINNQAKLGIAGAPINRLSPAISATFQPASTLPFRIRAFYKNIFRAPSFNDLYYTFIGNTQLRPEKADQYNLGITYIINSHQFINRVLFTIDGYHNNVRDKIIAVPRQNLFQWSMLNLGEVKINGLDATSEITFDKIQNWQLAAKLSYTYQQALDYTNTNSAFYKKQIPYTPQHSGSIHLSGSNGPFSIAYNMLASSYRYRTGEQLSDDYLKGWATHDLSVRYQLRLHSFECTTWAEFNNIFNTRYEIVKFYPMPESNYRLGIMIQL